MDAANAPTATMPNLLDPQLYIDGSWRRVFAEVRETNPVFRHPDPSDDGDTFVAVTTWAACTEVLRNHKVFRSEIYTRPDGRRYGGTIFDTWPKEHTAGMEHTLIHMEPPLHTAAKALVAPRFRESKIAHLRDTIREHTREAIRSVAGRDECDFIQDIAIKIPSHTLMYDIFGASPEAHDLAKKMSASVFGFTDEELVAAAGASTEELVAELRAVIMKEMEDRRVSPKDDYLTFLAHAEINGKRLEGDDLWELTNGLFFAGFDTTFDSIGLGMAGLLGAPDQVQRLRDDLSLIPTAIDEMLRYGSAVMTLRRTCRERYELCGLTVEPDEKVELFLASANQDPREFPNPDAFDAGRKPNRQLVMGHGIHRCLGAYLTKAEMGILTEETLANFDEIEINGEVKTVNSAWVRGLKRLPVRIKANPDGPAFAG